MAGDMKLGIVVDTDTRATRAEFSALRREVKREAEGMGGDWEAAAEKVEEALREAGARDDLVDAARRIGEQGPSEVEKMQRALRDLDDTARDVADDIHDAFQDNALTSDDIFDANFRAEMAASARETGSEILGQISSALADGSIDVATFATTLSEGLVEIGAEVGGPTGGALVAGGLIASTLWGQVTAQKEAVQTAVSDMFDSILTQGAAAAEQGQVLANIRALTEDQDKLNFSTKLARDLNLDLSTVIRARAGDEQAMAEVTAAHTAKNDELSESYRNGAISVGQWQKELDPFDKALEDVTNDFDTQRQGIDAAKASTDAYVDATAEATNATRDNALALAKSSGEAVIFTGVVDGATRSLAALPDGKVVEVTDDGTVTATQVAIDNIKGKTVEVPLVPVYQQDQFQRMYDMAIRGITPKGVDVWAQLGVRRPV
ncbi:hypothetical protein DBB34_09115 [Sphaerisporangium cinnabarinum]|nr:hypothetical protein [Sphaerisporangium cinnabarinum]PTU56411.1 hypothetical protein DBB34_09115 [Sphaerisporangium cinnabarinum]